MPFRVLGQQGREFQPACDRAATPHWIRTDKSLLLAFVCADLDGSAPTSAVIRNAGVEIVTTAIDMGWSITDLRDSVRSLTHTISER